MRCGLEARPTLGELFVAGGGGPGLGHCSPGAGLGWGGWSPERAFLWRCRQVARCTVEREASLTGEVGVVARNVRQPPLAVARSRMKGATGFVAVRGVGSVLIAAACFRATQNMALTTFALLGKDGLRLDAGAIGWLATLSSLVMVGVTMFGAARLGQRWLLMGAGAGIALLVPALILFAAARSVLLFASATVLLGVSGGLAFSTLSTMAGQLGGVRRERALALFTLTLSASLASGPVVESLILEWSHENIRSPFAAFVVLPLVAVAVLGQQARSGAVRRGGGVLPPPEGGPLGAETVTGALADPYDSVPSVASNEPGAVGERQHRLFLYRLTEGSLLRLPGWRLALTGQLLYAIPFAVITVFGALVARVAFGVPPAGAQLSFTAFFVTSFAARAGVAWRAPISRKLRLLGLSGFLTALGLVLLGTGHGLGWLLLAMAVLGVPHGLTFPLVLAQVADASEPGTLARANAGLFAATNVAAMIVPAIMGSLVAALGYRGIVLVLLVPVGACSLLLWVQRSAVQSAGVVSRL